jgi:predicted nucleic acid-binding protein
MEAIHLETEAKIYIQKQIRKKEIALAWSFMLDYENLQNTNQVVASNIAEWADIATTKINPSLSILELGKKLNQEFGIDQKDAIHVACAISENCDYFLTVDRKLLKKINKHGIIHALNPIDFLFILEENDE